MRERKNHRGIYENGILLAGGECTLSTRHSRVQQLGSARLSGPTMFAHGQQGIFKSYVINKLMVEKIIRLIRSVIAGKNSSAAPIHSDGSAEA